MTSLFPAHINSQDDRNGSQARASSSLLIAIPHGGPLLNAEIVAGFPAGSESDSPAAALAPAK
jgi:hypothetical protein